MTAMNALVEPSVDEAGRFDNAAGTRVSPWSVLPLRSQETGRSQPHFGIGDNDNSDVLERPLPPSAGRGALKLLGEWRAPEDEASAAVLETAAAVPVDTIARPTHDAGPDGDLVALGSLICTLSMILTLSGLIGLSRLLF